MKIKEIDSKGKVLYDRESRDLHFGAKNWEFQGMLWSIFFRGDHHVVRRPLDKNGKVQESE